MENKLVSAQIKQLKRLAIQHPNYSLNELKDALLVQNNSELLYVIEKALIKELSNISPLKNSNDYKWVYYTFKYMIEVISTDHNCNNIEHYQMLEKIKYNLNNHYDEIKTNLSHNLENFYNNINDILDPLIDTLEKETVEERKKKKEKDESNNLYNFADILIFKYKNFDYFYQISKTYPNLINCVNEKNIPLVKNLIKTQIKNINSKVNRNQLDYMYRVINYVVNSNYLELTNKQYNDIMSYLKREKTSFTNNDITDIELLIFIDDLIDSFKHLSKNVKSTRDFREIYRKYGVKEASDIYFPNIILPHINPLKIEDFTDKEVITMDLSKNIRYYDDAVSCEILDNGNYLVGVYIADLTDIIPFNSELDYIIYDRCETIYLEDKAIDMLPSTITNFASLNRGDNKKVIAYMFEFTASGELYDFQIKNAVINVKNNLTFSNAQKLYHINHNNKHGKIIRNIIRLHNEVLKSKFYNENYHILKEQKRKADDIAEYHINNDCSRALASLMILVNSFTAKFFADNNYPFLYRVNSSNIDDNMISKIQKTDVASALPSEVNKLINNVYSRSKYSHINTGHHGLGLAYYCHTTSPIRSYASIVTQRMIKQEFIDGGLKDIDLYKYEQILPQIANTLNNSIDTHNIFAEEYNKLKKKNK